MKVSDTIQILHTLSGECYSNARIIGEEGDKYIICTDCFNIIELDKDSLLDYYTLADMAFSPAFSIHDFIADIEYNIEKVKQFIN
jgi:hypothetical protein